MLSYDNAMKTLHNYLTTLHKCNELTKEECNAMRPKNGKLDRAHGLPKIHNEYINILKFMPAIDTIGTSHYSAGMFLKNILHPLSMNKFTFKDSFDTFDKIHHFICFTMNKIIYLLMLNLCS